MKYIFIIALILPLSLAAQDTLNINGLCANQKVYREFDKAVQYKNGGSEAFIGFLNSSINVPGKYKKNKGIVEVETIVNCEGKLLDAKLLSGVDAWIDKEVLAVIQQIRKWEPAVVKEEKVDAIMQYNVQFNGKKFKLK